MMRMIFSSGVSANACMVAVGHSSPCVATTATCSFASKAIIFCFCSTSIPCPSHVPTHESHQGEPESLLPAIQETSPACLYVSMRLQGPSGSLEERAPPMSVRKLDCLRPHAATALQTPLQAMMPQTTQCL